MPTLAERIDACRARIVADVQAVVPGVPVYDYFRNITHEATRAQLAADSDGVLHLWMCSLSADAPVSVDFIGIGHSQGLVAFELHGYRALDDANASEKAFDAECAAVIDAFKGDKKLGDNAVNAWPVSRAQGGWIQFSNGLCHYARLTIPARVTVEC